MLSPRLALRNILAHAHRSQTMFLVVALVSAVLFLLLSFSDGETENLKSGVIALNEPAADLVVYSADPREDVGILAAPEHIVMRGTVVH